jgi:hypothetical protein
MTPHSPIVREAGTKKSFEKTDCEGIAVAIRAPYFHLLDGAPKFEGHSVTQ